MPTVTSNLSDEGSFLPVPIELPNKLQDQQIEIFAGQPTFGEIVRSQVTENIYTIGGKIGEGSFSIVYSGTDTWNNQLAIKVIKPYSTYQNVRDAAIKEVLRLVHLRNPYVTYVHDAFEYKNSFYIITERCTFPVADLFKDPKFNGTSWVLPIARCLLQALHFFRINNVAHQDIHPGNVFGTFNKEEFNCQKVNSAQFKVGDLGVSKLLHELDPTNTRAVWMLPPEVLKPEQYGPIDYRSDLYHSALLLLQVAYSKELKFTHQQILDGVPREMALNLPFPFKWGLEKALRRRVQYRTTDAMQMWKDLNSPDD
jgi:serine/threonine protein kinase